MFERLTYVARFISTHPLTRDRKTEAFLRFAHFQIKARLKEEVIVPWVGGTRLAVRRGMSGATGNVYAGLHDFSEMAFLIHFLRPEDLFCDVGANVGSYSVLASGVCNARTVAFEPDPEAAAALRRNVEINGLTELVTVLQMGLGATEGTAYFTVGLDTCNRVMTDHAVNTREIRLGRLDELAMERTPTMLKVDVEGFNQDVVEGATRTLRSEELKAIIIEWPSEVEEKLTEFGFSRIVYDPLERVLADYSGENTQNNAIFIRDLYLTRYRIKSAKHFELFGRFI